MTARLQPEALHPELRDRFRRMPVPPIRYGWQRALIAGALKLMSAPKVPDDVTYTRVELRPGSSVHVFAPVGARSRGALLWIHGGGLVIGAAAQDHARCIEFARSLDIVVVSVDYRLAPKHPFPAPLDDCHAGWSWLVAHAAELGVDPGRLAIGGQSAGGGLSAALVQRVHDEGGIQPAAQWLFCPMLDDRTAADRSLDPVKHFVWNNSANLVGWSSYLGQQPGAATVPAYAVPALRTDLAGLPPAWIGAGDVELFYDEDRRYAEALAAAGVPTEFDVVPGGPHAFEALAADAPVSRAYMERALAWLRERIGG